VWITPKEKKRKKTLYLQILATNRSILRPNLCKLLQEKSEVRGIKVCSKSGSLHNHIRNTCNNPGFISWRCGFGVTIAVGTGRDINPFRTEFSVGVAQSFAADPPIPCQDDIHNGFNFFFGAWGVNHDEVDRNKACAPSTTSKRVAFYIG
jgi:hypothetical protein